MPEIGTSGLMSGVGKRGDALRQCSRPTSTLPERVAESRILWHKHIYYNMFQPEGSRLQL
jgi:hypothetical protein